MISNVGLSHVLYFPLTGGAILSHASFFCSSSFVTQSASSFLCFQYSIRKYNSIYIQKGAVKMMWHFRLQTWKRTPLMGHPCATHVLHDSVGSARTGRPVPGRPAGYCPSCDGCDEENRLACQDVSSSFISTRPPVNWPIWAISISWIMKKCGLFWPRSRNMASTRYNWYCRMCLWNNRDGPSRTGAMICFYRVFFFTAIGKSVHGQRGVRTPYPQAGPFPLPGGHNFSPFSTGLGDSCLSSPSRGTQVS